MTVLGNRVVFLAIIAAIEATLNYCIAGECTSQQRLTRSRFHGTTPVIFIASRLHRTLLLIHDFGNAYQCSKPFTGLGWVNDQTQGRTEISRHKN
jgi:hypothetical protein